MNEAIRHPYNNAYDFETHGFNHLETHADLTDIQQAQVIAQLVRIDDMVGQMRKEIREGQSHE